MKSSEGKSLTSSSFCLVQYLPSSLIFLFFSSKRVTLLGPRLRVDIESFPSGGNSLWP